jgi:LuxR family maltose regulon positive regulatory protein
LTGNSAAERTFTSHPLLATKLDIPRSRSTTVARPRLTARLDQALRQGHKLTLLSAPAGFGDNDLDRALSTLERALSLAEPRGYVRVFADEGGPLRQLLSVFRHQRPTASPDYTARLLAAFGVTAQDRGWKLEEAGSPPVVQPVALVETLSDREREVLRLVAAGLTNQELADRLIIALSTVKSHTNHIYGKLGVKNRTQAIAQVRALALP